MNTLIFVGSSSSAFALATVAPFQSSMFKRAAARFRCNERVKEKVSSQEGDCDGDGDEEQIQEANDSLTITDEHFDLVQQVLFQELDDFDALPIEFTEQIKRQFLALPMGSRGTFVREVSALLEQETANAQAAPEPAPAPEELSQLTVPV